MTFLLPSSSWLRKLPISSGEQSTLEASVLLSPAGLNFTVNRQLEQLRRLRQRKRDFKTEINICAMVTVLRLFLLAFYVVEKLRYRWTGSSAVVLKRENESFTVVC